MFGKQYLLAIQMILFRVEAFPMKEMEASHQEYRIGLKSEILLISLGAQTGLNPDIKTENDQNAIKNLKGFKNYP